MRLQVRESLCESLYPKRDSVSFCQIYLIVLIFWANVTWRRCFGYFTWCSWHCFFVKKYGNKNLWFKWQRDRFYAARLGIFSMPPFHAAFRQVQEEVGLLSRSSDRPRCSRKNPRQMSQTKNCEAVIENKLYLAKSVTLIIWILRFSLISSA